MKKLFVRSIHVRLFIVMALYLLVFYLFARHGANSWQIVLDNVAGVLFIVIIGQVTALFIARQISFQIIYLLLSNIYIYKSATHLIENTTNRDIWTFVQIALLYLPISLLFWPVVRPSKFQTSRELRLVLISFWALLTGTYFIFINI
ncbi:MAG: hypothetical protein ISR65_15085 [Bacteriovoracaceae bacterium]|nr:hypothetical protein [Bacteriovoracaceae bacterium]